MNAGSWQAWACNAWITSKIVNYYNWEALISFLGEKERKNTSEGKQKRKKIRAFASPSLERLACVASVSVGLGSRESQRNEIFGVFPARKMVREHFVPLPHPPLSFFGSHPIFRAGKTPKIPFLGLSLLPNPTETLATQAIIWTLALHAFRCNDTNALSYYT